MGGPGTGKSVVAINLLARLLDRGLNARYVSKNAAPRAVYEARLTGSFRKSYISNLFVGSGAFTNCSADAFDVLIVDEAHRLNEKSGLYGNLGENQIRELIHAGRCVVFFVDDDQRVTLKDIGTVASLRQWAESFGADITESELSAQFRCGGMDGYLAWLDNTLEIRPTANEILDTTGFDFRVMESPVALHEVIRERNKEANRARVVAGYCWPWRSKKDPAAMDIVIPEHGYQAQWNLAEDGSRWIMAPDSVEQVGCIHTCQGLELDYVGVIIGPDLVLRNTKVTTVPGARARSDQSVKGWKKLLESDPARSAQGLDLVVKNTYRALLTRGMKGCYLWATDQKLARQIQARTR